MISSYSSIVQKIATMRSNQTNLEADWQDLRAFFFQEAGNTTGEAVSNFPQTVGGGYTTPTRFTPTSLGQICCVRFGSYLCTSLFPDDIEWSDLLPPVPLLVSKSFKGRDDLIEDMYGWLQDVRKVIQWALYAGGSHFYRGMGDICLSIGAFGMGNVEIFDTANLMAPVRFKSWGITNGTVFDEGDDGDTDIVAQQKVMTVRQLLMAFGDTMDASCRDILQGQTNGETPLTIIHFVARNADFSDSGQYALPFDRKFRSVWLLGDMGDKGVLKDGGMDEMPYAIARWQQVIGSVYSTGPGKLALNALKHLFTMTNDINEVAAMLAKPPLWSYNGALPPNGAFFGPGQNTVVNQIGSENSAPINKFDIAGPPQTLEDRIAYYTSEAQKAFYMDIMEGFPEKDRVTATQINAITEQRLSTMIDKIKIVTETMLEPMLTRVYNILYRRRLLPAPPTSLLPFLNQGLPLQFSFTSAAYMRQQQMKGQTMLQSFMSVAQIYQTTGGQETISDHMNLSKLTQQVAENFDLPRDVIKTQEEIQAQQAQKQQQQNLANEVSQSQIASNYGTAFERNSQGARSQAELQQLQGPI